MSVGGKHRLELVHGYFSPAKLDNFLKRSTMSDSGSDSDPDFGSKGKKKKTKKPKRPVKKRADQSYKKEGHCFHCGQKIEENENLRMFGGPPEGSKMEYEAIFDPTLQVGNEGVEDDLPSYKLTQAST